MTIGQDIGGGLAAAGALGLALGGGGSPQYDPTSTILANLSGQQWQQAAALMYPAETQLIQYATDPNYIANQRAQAISGADTQFATQQSARARLLALQGITPTAAQWSAINKQDALAKAKSEAAAGNVAATTAAQTQNLALTGVAT